MEVDDDHKLVMVKFFSKFKKYQIKLKKNFQIGLLNFKRC